MLIPQSMAYALLANMPPIMGLYTACIAPIFYAALGTSMHLQIGPTSLVSTTTHTHTTDAPIDSQRLLLCTTHKQRPRLIHAFLGVVGA